jgi:hypothetical protein
MTPKFGRLPKFLSLILLILFGSRVCLTQVTTGTPPFGSFGGGPFDTVNLASLNVHFGIRILNKAGRGIPFTYTLSYDSSVWSPIAGTWQPVANWGWRGATEISTGYMSAKQTIAFCTANHDVSVTYSNFVYHDTFGTSHSFPGTARYSEPVCPPFYTSYDLHANATDGSGYNLFYHGVTPSLGSILTAPWSDVFLLGWVIRPDARICGASGYGLLALSCGDCFLCRASFHSGALLVRQRRQGSTGFWPNRSQVSLGRATAASSWASTVGDESALQEHE